MLLLIAALCGVMMVPFLAPVQAAPQKQAATNIVISEFRTRGPNGGNDEFVEIYNPTTGPVDISNWRIRATSGSSGGTPGDRFTFLAGTILQPGQYFVITGSNYSGGVQESPVASLSSTGIADDGGIAITMANGTTIIDQVGMSSTSTYLEGTSLSPMSATANQSYERRDNGCTDTNNNVSDFNLNANSSNPQSSSSPTIQCLSVTNVTSTIADGTYSAGAVIDVTITFSGIVSVTGTPTLILETGVTDRSAQYISGDGLNTLTFRYTVVSGDSSGDLDYVSINSLVLNGGTITGAVGNAILTLPAPGTAGSLGFNKNIIIDNGTAPSLSSFTRQNPLSSPTNANTLVFRATFSEAITASSVNEADFVVHPNSTPPTTTATVTLVTQVNGSTYDITITGGDLAGFNGTVGIDLSSTASITDSAGIALVVPATEPATDDVYIVSNVTLSVTINQAGTQPDPATGTPVNFTVVFSNPIVASTFTVSDITQTGASGVTWSITNSVNSTTFTVSAISVPGSGLLTLQPSLAAGVVADAAGNTNSPSSSTDNTVIYDASAPPTVTVNQASTQADPTSVLPVNFSVVFSEPINAGICTPADITQNGTATGITWSITNSGDNTNFTLSATAVLGSGTLVPSIPANRVTDLAGNINPASTSTDNSVTYAPVLTPTRTPTPRPTATRTAAPPPPPQLVAINEFVPRPGHDWNNDGAVNTGDEFIEILNHGTISVNLSGYTLDDEVNIGSSPYTLPSVTLDPGERIVFYGSQTNLLLSDGGDGVRMLRPNGELIDAFNYTVVNHPDQSFCRLPDNGGLDDWNRNCFPTPGLRNSLGGNAPSPVGGEDQPSCPIADTLPIDFFIAECEAFGHNIWNRTYWDETGWYGEQELPKPPGKRDDFVD